MWGGHLTCMFEELHASTVVGYPLPGTQLTFLWELRSFLYMGKTHGNGNLNGSNHASHGQLRQGVMEPALVSFKDVSCIPLC